MVKMAYAPLPKLACKPINSSKMCPKDVTNNALSDVLRSDPVKRLFNQPNIIIRTVSPNTNNMQINSMLNKHIFSDKKNGLKMEHKIYKPDISVVPIKKLMEQPKEDLNFLPSKTEGKSEIAIVPIKRERKKCGHYEPCENIVCDVAVQQYVDRDGASPMLATNIEDDEINAPVSKHCKNERCDALSIDHNRCRRACVKLHRCDQSQACDICGIQLKTRKLRVCHRNCIRRDEYRHNETNGAQVLKERMREREIQMMEASKAKKNDYLDPVMGHSLAMETLRNNEELIIIPKTVPIPQPTITITSVPMSQSTSQIGNANNVIGNFLSNLPIVMPQQSMIVNKKPTPNENKTSTISVQQVSLPEVLSKPFVTASSTVTLPQNQIIGVTGTAQTNIQPIAINNWVLSQSQIVTTTPIQPKPFLTPIRVVPITNLITQPSLLHQTQGIPKFCIMADNTVPPMTIINPQPVQPPVPVPATSTQASTKLPIQRKKRTGTKKSLKRRSKKKDFRCGYCLKRFSTDWYFKMHVAMHEGEKRFSCKVCKESFRNRYDMKKHMANDHKNENIPCDVCDHVCTSYVAFEKHMKIHNSGRSHKCSVCDISYTSAVQLKYHRRKYHGLEECNFCQNEYLETKIHDHIKSTHNADKETAKKEEETCKSTDTSDELSEPDVPSNTTKTNVNDTDSTLKETVKTEQQIQETDKKNGLVYIPVENGVKTIKEEIDSETVTHSSLCTP